MIRKIFAPGCALVLYKPELVKKIHLILNEHFGKMEKLMTCCHHDPQRKERTEIINICPGCDKRFRNDYENVSTISFWEMLAENKFIALPDYKGKRMSIIDACPARNKEEVQNAIRKVIHKMNITLIEPENTRTNSKCCGDSFYGLIPVERVKEQMIKRTSEMPVDDIIVYCVSCIKSVFIGGKKPHYLIDLIFAEETVPKTYEPEEWHNELQLYMDNH